MTTTLNQLLCLEPLLGPLLSRIRFIESDEVEIADCSHSQVRVNPWFFRQQEPRRRLFYLAHEVAHIALRHHQLLTLGYDHEQTNVAADIEVNLALATANKLCAEAGFEAPFDIPDSAIMEPSWARVSAHNICRGLRRQRHRGGHRVVHYGKRQGSRVAALRVNLFNPSILVAVHGRSAEEVVSGLPCVLVNTTSEGIEL